MPVAPPGRDSDDLYEDNEEDSGQTSRVPIAQLPHDSEALLEANAERSGQTWTPLLRNWLAIFGPPTKLLVYLLTFERQWRLDENHFSHFGEPLLGAMGTKDRTIARFDSRTTAARTSVTVAPNILKFSFERVKNVHFWTPFLTESSMVARSKHDVT